MAPGDLQEVLEGLKLGETARAHPELLVGLGRADDAAVYRVAADVAIVQTVDWRSRSKPLGTGVIVTAAKADAAGPDVLDGAVRSMLRLNRVAAEVAERVGVRGATDVTGFGFLGHAAEMVQAAGAGVSIDAARLPLLEGAQALSDKGHWSGGMKRNRRWVEATLGDRLSIGPGLGPGLAGLLFESATAGGLLFGTPPPPARRGRACVRGRRCA